MARSSDPDDATERQSRRSRRSANPQPERAQFLSRFPDHDELAPAVSAFVDGNYRDVRLICNKLLEREVDPEVHDAARELLRRIEPDRLVLVILWGSFGLLALIALWAFGHSP